LELTKKEDIDMIGSLSHATLQEYWWVIISLLGGILAFLFFVQGGQTFIFSFGKQEGQKLIVNTLGRKWEFTFTTLVTFGGAFFASFPLFYSTSFGGAYWVWMLILFCFVIQAVSYQYRSKPRNFLGHKVYEVFLFINGALAPFLIGVAIATFFTGSNFSVNEYNFSKWDTPYHGLEAALNVHNLTLGLAVLFLSRVLGLLYFINSIDDEGVVNRSRKLLLYNAIPFVIFFLAFTVWLMVRDGFAYDPVTLQVNMESFKYFKNLVSMPIVLVLFLSGVVLVLAGIGITLFGKSFKGIWFSGTGTILVVFSLFNLAGFNNTCYYPSITDLQSSLTIRNSSSSHFTLTTMSYVSLFVPFVAAYIFFVWRAINKKKLSSAELNNDSHVY
jgi:cytochrome bd ubiquinol oxidase subunit II